MLVIKPCAFTFCDRNYVSKRGREEVSELGYDILQSLLKRYYFFEITIYCISTSVTLKYCDFYYNIAVDP